MGRRGGGEEWAPFRRLVSACLVSVGFTLKWCHAFCFPATLQERAFTVRGSGTTALEL